MVKFLFVESEKKKSGSIMNLWDYSKNDLRGLILFLPLHFLEISQQRGCYDQLLVVYLVMWWKVISVV